MDSRIETAFRVVIVAAVIWYGLVIVIAHAKTGWQHIQPGFRPIRERRSQNALVNELKNDHPRFYWVAFIGSGVMFLVVVGTIAVAMWPLLADA